MRTICTLLMLGLLTMAVPAVSHADDAPATKITIRVKNQEIVKVIQTLAKFGKANVIVSPKVKVKGTISINLQDIPWKTALKVVVEAAGAKLIEEDYGILRVVPGPEVGLDREGRAAVKKKRYELLALETAKRAADMKVAGEMDSSRLLERAKAAMAAEAKVRVAKLELKALQDKVVELYAERIRLQPETLFAKEQFEKLSVNIVRGTGKAREPNLSGVVLEKDGKPVEDARVTLGFPERPFRGDGAQPGAAGAVWRRGPPKAPVVVQAEVDPVTGNPLIGEQHPGLEKEGAGIELITRRRREMEKRRLDEATREFSKRTPYAGRRNPKKDPLVIKRTGKGVYTATFDFGTQSGAQARRRIENLQSAARHLLAAGDEEGAKRIRAQAVAALRQLERQEALAKAGTRPSDVRGSIDGLRGEVQALRAEVRELTMLVRLLLQKQK